MGPDYRESSALRALGQIVGQHHPHLIPKGLPGAGNLLVFDNGGASIYGDANPLAPTGANVVARIESAGRETCCVIVALAGSKFWLPAYVAVTA